MRTGGPQLQHNLLFTDKTLHVVVQIASNAYKIASLRLTQHQQVVSSFSRCRRTRATRYIVLYTKVDWVIDLVVVLRATRHKISDTFSQANLLAVHGKKLNLTQQKHAFTNQKNALPHEIHIKTRARFSHLLLQHPSWKRSGSMYSQRKT